VRNTRKHAHEDFCIHALKGFAATFTHNGGVINTVTVTTPGSGYTYSPAGTCTAVCQCFGRTPQCSDGSSATLCTCTAPTLNIDTGGTGCAGHVLEALALSAHTDVPGEVNALSMSSKGQGYTCAPGVYVAYTGSTRCGPVGTPLRSDCAQDGTITAVTMRSRGQNYIPGDIRATVSRGTGFTATYTVGGSGAIDATGVTIANHGAGYLPQETLVSIVCMCVCVCLCVCVCVYIYIYIYIYVYARILALGIYRRSSRCVLWVGGWVGVYMCVCVCVYIYMYIHTHIHTTYTYIYPHTYMANIHMYIPTHNIYIYIYIHIPAHAHT
jgi:hypothetical protein